MFTIPKWMVYDIVFPTLLNKYSILYNYHKVNIKIYVITIRKNILKPYDNVFFTPYHPIFCIAALSLCE